MRKGAGRKDEKKPDGGKQARARKRAPGTKKGVREEAEQRKGEGSVRKEQ